MSSFEPFHSASASAFSPDHPGRTVQGKLECSADQIRFVTSSKTLQLPVSGLDIRIGGANDEQLFLIHPAAPGWTIYTRASTVRDWPCFQKHPALRQHMLRVRKRNRTWLWFWVAATAVLAFAFFLVLLAIGKRSVLVTSLADQVPVEWEITLGESAFAQITSEYQMLTTGAAIRVLQQIADRLDHGIPDSPYPLAFHLADSTNVNAFAMPGGNIVVFRGLIEAAESPEEIAGVLAHEIAHVTRRHATRKMIEQAGLWAIIQALAGDAGGLAAVFSEGSELLLRQKFSRDFEREADDTGWEYLVNAGIDPSGMIRFFERLRQIEGTRHAQVPGLLSTHPATEERIERLRARRQHLTMTFEPLEIDSAQPLEAP